jgi:hypothetical protein
MRAIVNYQTSVFLSLSLIKMIARIIKETITVIRINQRLSGLIIKGTQRLKNKTLAHLNTCHPSSANHSNTASLVIGGLLGALSMS